MNYCEILNIVIKIVPMQFSTATKSYSSCNNAKAAELVTVTLCHRAALVCIELNEATRIGRVAQHRVLVCKKTYVYNWF